MKRYKISAQGLGRSDDEWAEVEYEAEKVEDCLEIPKPEDMRSSLERRWKITKIVDCETGSVVWSGHFYR